MRIFVLLIGGSKLTLKCLSTRNVLSSSLQQRCANLYNNIRKQGIANWLSHPLQLTFLSRPAIFIAVSSNALWASGHHIAHKTAFKVIRNVQNPINMGCNTTADRICVLRNLTRIKTFKIWRSVTKDREFLEKGYLSNLFYWGAGVWWPVTGSVRLWGGMEEYPGHRITTYRYSMVLGQARSARCWWSPSDHFTHQCILLQAWQELTTYTYLLVYLVSMLGWGGWCNSQWVHSYTIFVSRGLLLNRIRCAF